MSDIGSLADAAAAVFKFFTPKQTEIVSQDYEQAAQTRLEKYESIMSQPDSDNRADELNIFYKQLCLDGKRPIGNLSGVVIPIPVEVLQSLTETTIDDIRAGCYLNASLKAIAEKQA